MQTDENSRSEGNTLSQKAEQRVLARCVEVKDHCALLKIVT